MQPLIVSAAILRRQKRVLITQRPAGKPHGGLWELPGGKLDGHESPRQALRRELREELDLEVAVGDVFEVIYHRYDWGPVLILAFECQHLAGVLRHLEVSDHRWILPEESDQYPLLPADRPIFAKLRASR
jgi:8-oxo-dGTP diphosphatase